MILKVLKISTLFAAVPIFPPVGKFPLEEATKTVVPVAIIFVVYRLTAVSAVADAVVSVVCPEALSVVVKRLVAVRAVVDALVSTELDAKMFCVKRLRNRSDDEPRENVSVTEGVMLPAI